MQKVINKMLDSLVEYGNIIQEEREIYSFGIECMILKAIHVISYVFLAIIMHQLFELLIMLSVLILLRKNAGGYHAKTRIGCYIVSCMTVYLSLLFHKLVDIDEIYFIGWILCSVMIFLLAPIDNANKRMDQIEKSYYKKVTRKILVIIGIAVLLCWLVGAEIIMEMIIVGMAVLTISLLTEKMIDSKKCPLKGIVKNINN